MQWLNQSLLTSLEFLKYAKIYLKGNTQRHLAGDINKFHKSYKKQGYHCPPFPPFWSSINEDGGIIERNRGALEELLEELVKCV